MSRRVVITGIGMVTPLGCGCELVWNNLINSKSGIGKITRFDTSELPDSISKIAGEINLNPEDPNSFKPEDFLSEKKDVKKTDKFVWYGLGAADEAINDSGWKPTNEEDLDRTGVIIGSGIGGIEPIQRTSIESFQKGIKKISPFFIPASLVNLISGHVSIRYGFRGPNLSIVTACASGTHTIGEAMEIIKRGDADTMITGGSESPICTIAVGGFSAMHALSTKFNDEPQKASRPWDRDRDGFVISEGAGVLVLEEYEHAKKRGAKIYCEIIGYGMSGDGYHITSPDPNGIGAKKAVNMALEKAKINPDEIDYINAHGTSTPAGDIPEFNVVKSIFNNSLDKLCMSSTKSSTGHMLGAAGAVEAIFSAKAIETGIVPPTLNLNNLDEACQGIDLVPHFAKKKNISCVLSNSFGFGGTNATVILKKI